MSHSRQAAEGLSINLSNASEVNGPVTLPFHVRNTYASRSSSVRYLGASAFTFSMNADCSFSSSFGGGVVRVATGTPTSTKKFSCPAGEQIQNMRTAPLDVLW